MGGGVKSRKKALHCCVLNHWCMVNRTMDVCRAPPTGFHNLLHAGTTYAVRASMAGCYGVQLIFVARELSVQGQVQKFCGTAHLAASVVRGRPLLSRETWHPCFCREAHCSTCKSTAAALPRQFHSYTEAPQQS